MGMNERIKEKRKAAGLTQRQVADYFGIKAPSVAEWESGKSAPEKGKLASLARLLRTTVGYLLEGTGDGLRVEERGAEYKVDPRSEGKVPLISEVQAGAWSEIVDNFQAGDAYDWIYCPFPHGPNTFVLKVSGFSMYNPGGEKSYAPGEFIAVDPRIEAQNRKMVVAKVDGEELATFKQLVVDHEGNMMLQALNPAHVPRLMPIPPGSRIVGVVIGKWVPE